MFIKLLYLLYRCKEENLTAYQLLKTSPYCQMLDTKSGQIPVQEWR